MNKERTQKEVKAKRGGPPPRILGAIGVAVVLAALVYLLGVKQGKDGVRLAGGDSANILLITLDTTRADHLGCYGGQAVRTPNLDRLAREGVRFDRVYCPAPLTLPSHCSIMTGLDPAAHGVHNNGHDLRPGIKTLAEIFKAHGYSTSAFVSSFSVDSRFGLDRGFDVYDDTFRAELPFKTLNAERRAEETFARFSLWLDKNGENRFFSWVHYYDPHWPYDPPPPYSDEFAGHPYDGEIAYMDHYVGALLDRLREKGILDRTVIVIAGDHGEGLGDKVEVGHGIFLYEETLRVPLILHHPAVFLRARVVESQVRLVDLAPTILEIAGRKEEAAAMKGQSLVSWIRGKTRKDLDSLVESFYPRENFGWSEMVGIVSDRWKLVQSPVPELYNLEKDPEERLNLYETSSERAAELKATLDQEVQRASSNGEEVGRDINTRAEDRERLRSLGYVNFAPAKFGPDLPDPKEKIGLIKLIQRAQACELEEKYVEAEQAYLKVLEDIPDSPAGYVNLAIVQALQKKLDRAIETLNRGISRIPDSEVLLVRLGHTHLVTGNPDEALETMKKVLMLNARNVDALTVSAGILAAAGRKEEAASYYKQALAIEPESRFLRMKYAGNLASSGRLREAIGIYEGLIADFPEEQAFLQYVGIAHSYLGEYDLAISFLKQALAVQPTPTGYFNLAVAYEKGGHLQEAAEYFRLYLENSRGENDINIRKAKAELENLEKKLGHSPF